MKSSNVVKIGGTLFFIGIIFIIYSWNASYPLSIPSLTENIFFSFYPTVWPGIIFSFLGLFLIAYCSKNTIIKIFCSLLFPLILYVLAFFFTYIPSADSGNVRGMFQIFNVIGIDSPIISYFEFPGYFSLNQVIHKIIGVDEKGVALISFILYGILLGLFLYLFFSRFKDEKSLQVMPFLLVFIYFIGLFTFLNFQWAPQTLALVYFAILIYISTFMLSRPVKIAWNFIFILLFIPFLFTHAFFPVIFLFYFGILTLKKRQLFPILLIVSSCYIIWTIYHTVYHFELYLRTFEQSIRGLGLEYANSVSRSLGTPSDLLDQIISVANRITVPLVWGVAAVGMLILFLKRKINYVWISLGVVGFFYLGLGVFYSILGLRAAQIVFIPLTVGFMFFITKWKKLTIALLVIILVLSVFGPMRTAYNDTQFQTDEEACGCNFLATNLSKNPMPMVAISQVNWGFFTNKYMLQKNTSRIDFAIRPGTPGFSDTFQTPVNPYNSTLKRNEYVFYNANFGKEMLEYEWTTEQLNTMLGEFKINNKIYDSGTTFVINGAKRK
jgi:hypothetical protein